MDEIIKVLLQTSNKIDINNVITIIFSGLGGIILSYFSSFKKLKKSSIEKANESLQNVYLPITKLIYHDLNPYKISISKIQTNCKFIYETFEENILCVPPIHIKEIKLLMLYLEEYSHDNDRWEKIVRRKYKKLQKFINVYTDYLKRNLGYPNENLKTYYSSVSYSPQTSRFILVSFLTIFFILYLLFLLMKSIVSILVFNVLPLFAWTLFLLIKRRLDYNGGIRISLSKRWTNIKASISNILHKFKRDKVKSAKR